MTAPKAVLLDLDDTLYPEREYAVSGLRAVAAFLAGGPHLAQGFGEEELAARLISLLEQGRDGIFDRMLQLLGIDSPPLLSTLVHVYRTHRPELSLFSEVPAVLRWLRNQGVRLGIITDGKGCMQRSKLAALGLEPLVDTVVCTDDLLAGCAKPSPVPFQVALCRLKVAPEQAVYIGDDLAKDFLAPRELGMRSIRLDRRLPHPLQKRTDFPEHHHADALCRDLEEAAALLFPPSVR